MTPILHTSSEATRARLLEAGRQLFAEEGLEGARVDRLAHRAGVNKALINYHFQGKTGLYRAVLEEIFREAAEELDRRIGGEVAPRERLRAWASALGEIMDEKPGFAALFLRELLSGGEHLDGSAGDGARQALDSLRETLSQGRERGDLQDVDPFLVYLLLLGGAVLARLSAPYRERLEGPESDRDPKRHLPKSQREMVPFLEDLIQRGFLSPRSPGIAPPGRTGSEDRPPQEGE